MADKIIQLKDQNGNNLYPLSTNLRPTDYISQCTTTNFSLDSSSYLLKFPNGLVVFYLQGINTAQFQTGGANFLQIPYSDFIFPGSGGYMFFAGTNPWATAACNFALYADRTNSKLYFRAYPLANRAANTRFDVAGCYFASEEE